MPECSAKFESEIPSFQRKEKRIKRSHRKILTPPRSLILALCPLVFYPPIVAKRKSRLCGVVWRTALCSLPLNPWSLILAPCPLSSFLFSNSCFQSSEISPSNLLPSALWPLTSDLRLPPYVLPSSPFPLFYFLLSIPWSLIFDIWFQLLSAFAVWRIRSF